MAARHRSYIPAGTSYWEITTARDPETEATSNLHKRSKALSSEARADATFIFVTPRTAATGGWSEPRQSGWIANAKSRYNWRDIRVLDANQLSAWLQGLPALGRWLAVATGRLPSAGSILTPLEYWNEHVPLADGGEKQVRLPSRLFLADRDQATDALRRLLSSETQKLLLLAESEYDVDDFVAAYLQSVSDEQRDHHAHHCLFVRDIEAWQSLCEVPTRHVLVASPRLGLDDHNQTFLTLATTKGHAVIVPLCGGWPAGDENIVRLHNPSQATVETVLRDAGLPTARCRELAQDSGGQLAALRRSLLGLGSRPPYATWSSAAQLAQAGLIGRWNAGNLDDRSAIETVVDRGYSDWIFPLRSAILRPESPIVQHNELWRFAVRSEAWSALGRYISDDDLNRFRGVAVSLLSEDHPKFDLPRNQRYAAAIYDKVPKHSDQIRAGIAESVALLGSRSQFLSSCSQHRPADTARRIVHVLLADAQWTRWASLGPHLPLMAEGAPEQFLAAVESDLGRRLESPLRTLLEDDSQDSGFLNAYETAGLLWALETLAWSPDYLSRVAVILATMASMDPGSRWVNGPQNTLRTIFLPWCPQTSADDGQKTGAIKAVMREQEEIAWKLLVSLLPHGQGFSTGCRQPTWRPWVPRDWTGQVRLDDYQRTVVAYFDLAVQSAGVDPTRLRTLVERLPELPSALRTSFLSGLGSDDICSLSERDRFAIWEELDAVLRRHRRFHSAQWALPEADLAPFATAANALRVESPVLKARWLFPRSPLEATDGQDSTEQQLERLEEQRRGALRDVIQSGGIEAVFALATEVPTPGPVGDSLAHVVTDREDAETIARYSAGLSESEHVMLSCYVWRRFALRGWPWAQSLGFASWSCEERAKFLALLPFQETVWSQLSRYLEDGSEHLYWERVNQNPYFVQDDMSVPIREFIKCGRFGAAVTCINSTVGDRRFNSDLASFALLALLESQEATDDVDGGAIVDIIVHLQECPGFSRTALCDIEWAYLGLLGIGSRGSPITLEIALASDPVFFISVLELVFKKSTGPRETDTGDTVERDQSRARNAFQLLESWCRPPGMGIQEETDSPTLRDWVERARQTAQEKDLSDVSDRYIGKVLVHALRPSDDNWVPEEVAELLNEEVMGKCRDGFFSGLLGQRGGFAMTGGREEARLAGDFRLKARRLDGQGYARLAGTVREVAEHYSTESERFAADEAAGE